MSFNDLLRESQASEGSVRVSSGVSLSRLKTAFIEVTEGAHRAESDDPFSEVQHEQASPRSR